MTLDTAIIKALQVELHACKGMDIDGQNLDAHIVLCSPTAIASQLGRVQ